MLRKVAALVIVFIAVVLAGCALLSHEAPNEDVDKAAALFFQRLDQGGYDTIYDDASKRLRQNKTRATVTDSLKQLAAQGKTLRFDRTSMMIQGEGKDRMLLPVYKVSFEQAHGDVELTFQDEGGEWKLFGFSFKPRG
ncbi:MAG: hypothetical protein AABN33_22665 [Acidobacteriota bacterium]